MIPESKPEWVQKPADAELPPGWWAEPSGDGTLSVVEEGGKKHLQGAGCLGVIALAWNGLLAGLVAQHLRTGKAGWPEWLVVAVFGALGLLFAFGSVWVLLAKEEWRVGPGFMEVRWRFFGWESRRSFTQGVLRMTYSRSEDDDESWALVLETPERKQTLRHAQCGTEMTGPLGEMVAVGHFLERETGWPLKWPHDRT
jgi:hypothetical protein